MTDDMDTGAPFGHTGPVRIPPIGEEPTAPQPVVEAAPAASAPAAVPVPPAIPSQAWAADTGTMPAVPPHRGREDRGGSKHSTGAVIASGLIGGVIGAIIIAGTAGALYFSTIGTLRPATSTASAAASGGSPVTIAVKSLVEPAVAVAKKVLPSVVNVTIYQNNGLTGTTQAVGNGSGVVYKAGGYIVTNNHVVESADRITVKVGTQELPAKVIGTDPKTDLAVIKVDKDLEPITIGDSAKLQVGQTVIAVGSPFGLDKTVTSGIVSALGRSELGDQTTGSTPVAAYTNLIQTDAAINPGNSGGALVDTEGNLVGINTMIVTGSQTEQNAGVGFAIPSATVVSVVDQIIATGKVSHPFLGVSSVTLTPDIASTLGSHAPSTGAVAVSVIPGSPAAKAGIQTNDVITRVGSTVIDSADALVLAIRGEKVGDTIPVVVWRNGQTLTVNATVGTDLTTATQ